MSCQENKTAKLLVALNVGRDPAAGAAGKIMLFLYGGNV